MCLHIGNEKYASTSMIYIYDVIVLYTSYTYKIVNNEVSTDKRERFIAIFLKALTAIKTTLLFSNNLVTKS